MLATRYKAVFDRVLERPARALARALISPSTVTVVGVVLVGASCAFLILTHRILIFCVLATLASLFDVLDGAVARASGRVTKFGADLDAICDRVGEALIVLAVAAVTGYWALSSVMVVGAGLVSYAKARAAMEVPVANLEWPDVMERTERGSLYLAGLLASRLLRWRPLLNPY